MLNIRLRATTVRVDFVIFFFWNKCPGIFCNLTECPLFRFCRRECRECPPPPNIVVWHVLVLFSRDACVNNSRCAPLNSDVCNSRLSWCFCPRRRCRVSVVERPGRHFTTANCIALWCHRQPSSSTVWSCNVIITRYYHYNCLYDWYHPTDVLYYYSIVSSRGD